MSAPIGSGDEADAVYGDEVYADGVSDTDDVDENETLTGGYQGELADTGYSPPDREPVNTRWGTTAFEEAQGEPLDLLLAEEEPDVFDAEPAPLTDEDARAGRLVAPNAGIGPDDEKDEVAFDAGYAGSAASAEEAAVHVVDEDDAMTSDDGSDYSAP
jgi:hypothetical protein